MDLSLFTSSLCSLSAQPKALSILDINYLQLPGANSYLQALTYTGDCSLILAIKGPNTGGVTRTSALP